MSLLISLHVKYGFPVYSLYGFLKNVDHQAWESFLKDLSYEISVNSGEGHVFILITGYADLEKLKKDFCQLPLLKEEFLEIKVHEFINFKTLDCFFTDLP